MQAIVINLNRMQELIVEFCREHYPDSDDDIMQQLTLGHFMLWLTKKQETYNGQTQTAPRLSGAGPD